MQTVALGARFVLEVLALVALGAWGWHAPDATALRWLDAAALPTLAALVWGVFRIPNDPKAAPVAVPGPIRLLLEALFFGAAVAALVALDQPRWGTAFGGAVLVDYALLPARVRRLLRWR